VTNATMNATYEQETSGGRLVSTDGRALPLLWVEIAADARGGIARVVLEQRYRNPYPDPLNVTYLFPLPHDAAVSGFAFRLGERRVTGEVDRVAAARERYERALLEGRSAALLEQERGSVFTQELGNVPPGADIVAELTIDQRLAWLPQGAWEWRFPTALAPRYQGTPGRVQDAGSTFVDVADGGIDVRARVSLAVRDVLADRERPESPSHAMRFDRASGLTRATFADDAGAPLDRDVVVRWPVAGSEVGLTVDAYRAPAGGRLDGRAFALLTAVPPGIAPAPLARDLVVLLDTSGSMDGEPLTQARRVVAALIGSLSPADSLELIAFSSVPVRWRAAPAEASEAVRVDALAWLDALRAFGGTEMRHAVDEALRPLRPDAQRQVVLVTDGHVGFETEIVASVLRDLPPGSRLHTVGVGSAVNRSLTAPAARAGRGREVVIGLGEDPERAAGVLRAHTAGPIVTELAISGDAVFASAPARLPDLYVGAPALIALEVRPEGGTLTLRGRTADGAFERSVRVPALRHDEGNAAAAALFGREAVEDLEMRGAAAPSMAEVSHEIERLGLAFQLATRSTSWVAVSEEASVDPRAPFRRERMPQAVPYGMSVEGMGLRAASGALMVACCGTPSAPHASHSEFVAYLLPSLRMPEWDEEGPEYRFEWDEPPLPSSSPPRLPPVRAVGRVRSDQGGLLVIEIPLRDEAVSWVAPARVNVSFSDGRTEELEVDPEMTTAPCQVTAGQTIRLAVRLSGLAQRSATAATVQLEDRKLHVRISRQRV
jgi:Ca-activated chloride channel family protein